MVSEVETMLGIDPIQLEDGIAAQRSPLKLRALWPVDLDLRLAPEKSTKALSRSITFHKDLQEI